MMWGTWRHSSGRAIRLSIRIGMFRGKHEVHPVLIIEMSATLQHAVRRLLKASGHTVTTARTYEEGLERVKDRNAVRQYAAVIFGHPAEPNRHANELLTRLRLPECRDLPVLVLAHATDTSLLIYGPPGTGKSLLARALATEAEATFYHLKLTNLTSKFGHNTGDVLQEILSVAKEQGKGVVFLDEADALSLEHLLPPAQAREASARLVAALCEKLDGLEDFSRMVVVAATNRTDAVDPSLV